VIYKDAFHAFATIAKDEGFGAFYRGSFVCGGLKRTQQMYCLASAASSASWLRPIHWLGFLGEPQDYSPRT
jgi:hypothetical protein